MISVIRLLIRLGWPLRVLRPVLGRFNPFDPTRRTDPYPLYERMRRESPVYLNRTLGIWFLFRHRDVESVLKDARFSVQRSTYGNQRFNPLPSLSPEFQAFAERTLLMVDPPDHSRLRGLVSRSFTPRRVETLRPRIESLVHELIDVAAAQPVPDLVRDLASPLPILVISELLGVPAQDREQIRHWTNDLVALLDPFSGGSLAQADRSYHGLAAYLRTLFAARRREPREDLISALVRESDGDRLNEVELCATVALILGAGHETTTNLIGNAALALLRHPDERKRLLDQPALVESAVEEFLRYDAPVQVTDRVATEDIEIDGQRIRRGQFCVLLLGSANRDAEVFADPDRLDIGRTENRHLSFGAGIHFCLGARLARLEAQVALRVLLERFPRFSGDVREPRWRPSMTLRGVTSLPVSLR
jgi:pimeloyl-[acyl-carrier protein] synthase